MLFLVLTFVFITGNMDEQEKYLFDLRGYLVVKDALTETQVKALSEIVDGNAAPATAAPATKALKGNRFKRPGRGGSDRTRFRNDDDTAWSASSLLDWGGPFIDLIDIPTIAPYLETLLGVNYRLDHDYMLISNAEFNHQLYLHGGGQGAGGPTDLVGPTDGGQCYYRFNNGRFFNGLVAVDFELNTVTPGDGGFACVPGSHKANFELPKDWKVSETQADIPDCVDRVAASAGDAIIFTEACAHGTVPWEGEKERRTLFYKYCPHAVAWSPCYYNSDHYEGLTENQRAILMPPSAFGPSDRTIEIWQKAQAEQAELMRLREELADKA